MNFASNIELNQDAIKKSGEYLTRMCHGIAAESGWWTNMKTGESLATPMFGLHNDPSVLKVNIPEKLCLMHSEISEAMEGFRKNLMDDKLPHRSMLEVELADVLARLYDLAGGLGLDVGGALAEKLAFNAKREDHKLENRAKDGGKAF